MVTTTTGLATSFITFTRTSNATVTDSNGFIKWAGHNLLTNSESFDASAWSRSGISAVTANSTAAPNGTTTADTVVEDTSASANHFVAQTPTIAAAQAITYGVWVKRGSGTRNIAITIIASGGSDYISQVYDLGAGTLGSSTAVGTGVITDKTISSAGSGWYYITLTGTPSTTAAVTGGACRLALANGTTFGSQTYTGDGTSSVILWGAHLYRSDLGGMVLNPARGDAYYPTTPRNLLRFTESLTTGWTNSNTTDSIVTETNPNGLASSVEVTATAGNGTLLGSLSLLASPYTFSIWLKRKTGTGTVEITVDGTTYVAAAVTGTWTRFSTTLTPTAGTKTPGIRLVTSGDAVFAWGAQLSDSASLDAYSPVYGAAVTSAAYYAPRLDYDPVTLAARGLLVEEQRTNLLLNSATLSTQNATVTAVAHTLSFYGTGTVTLSGASTAGPLVGTGAYPNRVTLTFTPTAGTLTLTVTGSVTQAQLEAGSFATSYIPTGAATATRTADVASVSTQAFPYSSTAGTIVVAYSEMAQSIAMGVFCFDNGTANNRIDARTDGYFAVLKADVVQADGYMTGISAVGAVDKIAITTKANDFAAVANGGTVVTDTSGDMPSAATALRIGSLFGGFYANGHIRQITYIPRRLTNAELVARST